MAGVGAPIAATGASNNSTSSASLSSLVPSEMWDILPDTIDEAGVVKLEPLRERRASGDGESLENGDGEP